MTDHPGFLFEQAPPPRTPLRAAVTDLYLADETALVNRLLAVAEMPPELSAQIVAEAAGCSGCASRRNRRARWTRSCANTTCRRRKACC